jgi:hypothetical protein
MTTLSLALAPLILAACPDDSARSAGPVETCTKVGEQCKMGGGQLGVCMTDMNVDPPKLFCMSQH